MVENNLWASFMSEARYRVTSKLPPNKSLIVLGANGSGKTTLVSKLRQAEVPNNGCGLEYTYLDIRDEYFDEHTIKLGIWILDGEPALTVLLKKVLNEKTYADTTIMLVASMSTPWLILQQLEQWIKLLNQHVNSLAFSKDEFKAYKCKNIRRWRDYVPLYSEEEVEELKANSKYSNTPIEDEGVLINNLGLDIIVAVTKTDYMSKLETIHQLSREHFDYVQQRIRRFCLHNGLSLTYTSIKNDENFELLRKYIMHKIYNFPLEVAPIVSEVDSIFIPAGYDNMRNISILLDNLITLNADDTYETVIPAPLQHHSLSGCEQEIFAEDEQIYLQKQFELLQWASKNAEPLMKLGINRILNSPNQQKLFEKRFSYSTPTNILSPARTPMRIVDSVAAENNNSSELASFFNTLLRKGFRSTTSKNTSTNTTETNSCTPVSCRNDDSSLIANENECDTKKKIFCGRSLFGPDDTTRN